MVEIVTEHHALASMEAEWDALAQRFSNPFLTHACCFTAAQAFTPPGRLAVHVLRDRQGIRAIAPLHLVGEGADKRLMHLAHTLREPLGLLYRDEEALEDLIKALMKARWPLLLDRLDSEMPEATALHRLQTGRRLTNFRYAGASYWVPLANRDMAALEASMSKDRRSKLRSYRRKAEAMGTVEFAVHAPGPDGIDGFLKEFFRVEAQGWKGRTGVAIQGRPDQEHFYTEFPRRLARHGALRLYEMKIDGVMIAGRVAADLTGKLWELKIGYDERFAACRPGLLLTHETLRDACELGRDGYEFLGYTEDWERYWAPSERRYECYRSYPLSTRGAWSLASDAFRYASSRARLRFGQADAAQAG